MLNAVDGGYFRIVTVDIMVVQIVQRGGDENYVKQNDLQWYGIFGVKLNLVM